MTKRTRSDISPDEALVLIREGRTRPAFVFLYLLDDACIHLDAPAARATIRALIDYDTEDRYRVVVEYSAEDRGGTPTYARTHISIVPLGVDPYDWIRP